MCLDDSDSDQFSLVTDDSQEPMLPDMPGLSRIQAEHPPAPNIPVTVANVEQTLARHTSLPQPPVTNKPPVRRGPGRPRKERIPGEPTKPGGNTRGRKPGQSTKGNHLWEFIRDLLKNPTHNPKVIKWEDEEDRVFRIVQSETVASMWGSKKNNPNMTYEKLSRALR